MPSSITPSLGLLSVAPAALLEAEPGSSTGLRLIAMPVMSCVTLGKPLNLSVLWFPQLPNGGDYPGEAHSRCSVKLMGVARQDPQPRMASTLLVYLPPNPTRSPLTPSLLSALFWAPEAKIGTDFPSGGLLRFSQDGQCPRLPEEAPWGLAQIQPHAAVSGGLRRQGTARGLRGQSSPCR